MPSGSLLSDSRVERVLPALGFSSRPEPTLSSLRAIYAAWGRSVPFDNARKLIHLHRQDAAPLPGTAAEDFLEAWLRHRAGGTCWAGANAFHAVLTALGFDAERVVATMMAAPNLPPNHGSVRVHVEGGEHLVDTSMLTGEPLRLDGASEITVPHPAWGVRGETRDGKWHIRWRPLLRTEGFDCRLESFGADHGEYRDRHEITRGWSPFNFQLSARINRGDTVMGVAMGNAVVLHADGTAEQRPIDDTERRRILIEDFGMSEELVFQLPADRPTPPPPGSKTAAAQG